MSQIHARSREDAEQGRADPHPGAEANWVDGIPYVPDEEADAALMHAAARWPDLMRRLSE